MKRILVSLCFVAVAAQASAQVPIDRVPAIAQAVHDAERVNLGASSTRDSRNAFWARVVGIIHFGHPVYNPTPDPNWCIKDGGGGRPQSDDVIVKCRSREFWDCIPGSGADGYRFQCSGDGVLPANQNVYIPPRPAGAGSIVPPPPPPPATTNLQPVLDAIATLTAKVDAIAALSFAAREAALNATLEAASAAHEARAVNQWRMTEPFKAPVIPCIVGRVPKMFGGSSEVTFCPVP